MIVDPLAEMEGHSETSCPYTLPFFIPYLLWPPSAWHSAHGAPTAGAPPSRLSIKVYKYADHSLLGETTVDIPAILLGTQYNAEFYAFVTARSDYAILYIDPDNTIPEKQLQNNRIKLKADHVTFVP